MKDNEPTMPGSPRATGWLSHRRGRRIAAAALAAGVIGLTAGCAASATSSSPSATATPPSAASGFPGAGGGAAGGGSNARSGPASGGSSGTVDSVSASGFTMKTAAGQEVTVDEASSTTYRDATTSSTSASAITSGDSVLVLGMTSGTTITATQVAVQPTASSGSASSTSAVVPFERGAPSQAQQDGQIPADYTEGSGTIVSGTAANKATEAALAAYPGGVVDRVVQLSSGEYEVHYIGVNWPHHIFVDQSFTVVGAN
jgi:hypothetical protein